MKFLLSYVIGKKSFKRECKDHYELGSYIEEAFRVAEKKDFEVMIIEEVEE